MKIHRSLVLAVVQSMLKIFEEGAFTEQVVEKLLKSNPRWGSRDRKFLAGTIYSVVRRKRLYESVAESIGSEKEEKYFTMLGVCLIQQGNELPDWPEFQHLKFAEIKTLLEHFESVPAIKYSVPEWLNAKGEKEFGVVQWTKEMEALNQEAEVVIRANSLKTTKNKLLDILHKEGIETRALQQEFCDKHGIPENAIVLKQRVNFRNSAIHQSGYFEFQDAGSQLIAPFLEALPGEFIIDACAGAGGKTLHLAALMQNKGEIIAMDVEEGKLKILEQRAKRAGVKIVRTQFINQEGINNLAHTADKLLMDVPCSGSGVLRRQVDTKWKLSEEEIQRLIRVQRNILKDYVKMLKPGGQMVYATCSIFREENEEQVEWFLKENQGRFELISQARVNPSEGYDGFYMARIKKQL